MFTSHSGTVVPLVLSIVLYSVTAGYVVTFPRKWVTGARTQICLALDFPPGPNDGVTLEVVGSAEDESVGSLPGGIIGGLPGGNGGGLLGGIIGGLPEGNGGGLLGGIIGGLPGGNGGGLLGGIIEGLVGGGNGGGLLGGIGEDFPGGIGGGLPGGIGEGMPGGIIGGSPGGIGEGLGIGGGIGMLEDPNKKLGGPLARIKFGRRDGGVNGGSRGELGGGLDGRLDANTTVPLMSCEDFEVPDGLTSSNYDNLFFVRVAGSIRGVDINETVRVKVIKRIGKVFLQTDKEIYKPGQLVQFRVLTLEGVYLNVSTESYPQIYVESPSGSRIAQWLDVPNPSGLIHRELQLIDEAQEGPYRIVVRSFGVFDEVVKFFRVEDYVLPRFEVTFAPPPYILASDETLKIEVCAKYTFGQPVRGNVSININSFRMREINFRDELVGCDTFEISTSALEVNDPNFYAYALGLKIKVEEEDTGVVVEEIISIPISRTVISFSMNDVQKYVKPELPVPNSIIATYPNGEPAVNEPVLVCWKDLCRNSTTDESGILRVVIPPHSSYGSDFFEVTAVNYPHLADSASGRPYMYASSRQFYMQQYYSPSNSSLLINSDTSYLNCVYGSNLVVTLPVLYASQGVSQTTLYVLAMSRGQIQFWKTYEAQFLPTELPFDESELLGPIVPPASSSTIRGAFNLILDLPPTVSDTVNVLIWYTRPDGEVVSAEQQLSTSQCLNYPVELSWPTDRTEHGTELPLTLTAQPNSLCSIGIVDKSVELLSAPQSSLIQQVFQLVDQANIQPWERPVQINDNEYCRSKVVETTPPPVNLVFGLPIDVREEMPSLRSSFFPGFPGFYSNMVDAIKMFDQAGLNVLSDQTLETRPCLSNINSLFPSPPGGSNIIGGSVGGGGGFVGALLGGSSGGLQSSLTGGDTMGLPLQGGNPELSATSSQGETRTYFPETWLWELQTLPDSGIYTEDRILPDTITEWVGRAVCVHPDQGVGISASTSITTFTSFFIDLTLPPSIKVGEILPVKISVFNYLNTTIPVLVTLEESSDYEILGANGTEAMADQAAGGQRSACVPTQDKETVVVRIRPLVAGSVFINVTAVVDTEFAEPCSSGEVLNKIDRISKPIAVDYEGFPRENTWTSFICDTDSNGTTWNLDAPANIVNNSIRAWINVAGDLLAPTLDNLGHLIRMPYGCGEQNMVTFTPNIYVLQYLQASNQANEIVTERLLTYMRNGYQRELTFKRSDGSYGCFGETDESGSTWLTAFVVKSYAQSLNFIDVDLNEILMSSNFLKSVQLESGCFASVGTVHNKRMKGGVGASDTPGTLTAYVMAALLEAGVDATVPAITSATACINAATAPGTEGENDIYLLALKAYAYSLAGLPQTEDTINDLLDRSTQVPEAIYWDMNSLNGLYSSALSVETASYVLLAMLTANIPDSQQTTLNIVKGISYWFNGLGSFVSTQDTVVALQALALYASHQDQPLNLDVTAVGDNLNVVFQITESNKLVIQRADVDVISNNVTVDATGSGCALVQAVVRFNVPDPNLSEVFLLSVETFVDYNNPVCRANRIRICGTYLLNDGESNMGIIEVNLVSGYAPQIEDLERIVSDVTGSIMRYEVEDGKVLFYINQFTDSETCIEFTATEVTEVEDVRPGTVKIYDYYEPEFFMSETYTFTRRVCRT